jgi:hypothetical protein
VREPERKEPPAQEPERREPPAPPPIDKPPAPPAPPPARVQNGRAEFDSRAPPHAVRCLMANVVR